MVSDPIFPFKHRKHTAEGAALFGPTGLVVAIVLLIVLLPQRAGSHPANKVAA